MPTLMAGDLWFVVQGPNNFFTPAQSAKALQAGPMMLDMTRRAPGGREDRFAPTPASPHGDNAGSSAAGQGRLTPLEAVQAATVNAADHLQISAIAGS